MTTRRMFLATLAAAGCTPAMARALTTWQPESPYDIQRLREGCWAIIGQGGNVLLLSSDAGPVIIDAKLARGGVLLSRTIQQTVDASPVLLINTHHHADHTGGNWAFSHEAEIIAHKNVRPRLEASMPRYINEARQAVSDAGDVPNINALRQRVQNLSLDDFTADREVDERLTIEHGGRTIHLHHFGRGHTDNDLVVHLPELNVLHAGDLLFHQLYPFIDRPAGAHTPSWERALGRTIELTNTSTIVVPGHGRITRNRALREQISFFRTLREEVDQARRLGMNAAQVAEALPTISGYGNEQFKARCITAIYEELSEGIAVPL